VESEAPGRRGRNEAEHSSHSISPVPALASMRAHSKLQHSLQSYQAISSGCIALGLIICMRQHGTCPNHGPLSAHLADETLKQEGNRTLEIKVVSGHESAAVHQVFSAPAMPMLPLEHEVKVDEPFHIAGSSTAQAGRLKRRRDERQIRH